MAAIPYQPACQHCGRLARHLGKRPLTPEQKRDGAYGPWFCSRRCAADWALDRGGSGDVWCGVPYENTPHSETQGPHGWHEFNDCPECEGERDD